MADIIEAGCCVGVVYRAATAGFAHVAGWLDVFKAAIAVAELIAC